MTNTNCLSFLKLKQLCLLCYSGNRNLIDKNPCPEILSFKDNFTEMDNNGSNNKSLHDHGL